MRTGPNRSFSRVLILSNGGKTDSPFLRLPSNTLAAPQLQCVYRGDYLGPMAGLHFLDTEAGGLGYYRLVGGGENGKRDGSFEQTDFFDAEVLGRHSILFVISEHFRGAIPGFFFGALPLENRAIYLGYHKDFVLSKNNMLDCVSKSLFQRGMQVSKIEKIAGAGECAAPAGASAAAAPAGASAAAVPAGASAAAAPLLKKTNTPSVKLSRGNRRKELLDERKEALLSAVKRDFRRKEEAKNKEAVAPVCA